jgi:PleD family two-component response regulator
MMSSASDSETISRSFESGAEDFLIKPIRPEILKRRVEACLDERRRLRGEAVYRRYLQRERAKGERLAKQVEELSRKVQSQETIPLDSPVSRAFFSILHS